MSKLILTIASSLSIVTTSPAIAGGHTWRLGHDAYNVQFSDLDLRSREGRSVALRRVEAAGEKLCREAGTRRARIDCRDAVVAKAMKGPTGGFIRVALAERERERIWLARKD